MWKNWRARSAGSVTEEMLLLHSRHKAHRILFADDIFLVKQDRGRDICQQLHTHGSPINWGFSTRIETLSEDIIPELARGGVDAIFLGIESGSERVLAQMKRRYTCNEVIRKVELCRDHGITCTASFILGLPWETESDVGMTFSLMRKLATPRVLLNIFTPLAGTVSSQDPESLGIVLEDKTDPDKSVVGHGYVGFHTQHLSTNTIKRLWLEGQGLVMQQARDHATLQSDSRRYGLMEASDSKQAL